MRTLPDFRCVETDCSEEAEYLIWYENSNGLYSYKCREHTELDLHYGNVEQIKSVESAILNSRPFHVS